MSIKQSLVRTARQILPSNATKVAEELYRRGRVRLVSLAYGMPARGMRVLAVTGTNGKTTTINYLNEILKESGAKTAMYSTALIEILGKSRINDSSGTVGSTAEMQRFFKEARNKKVDFVILEMTSHALQQHKLEGVPIEAGVMTNLTRDHLDYHKTMEAYAEAKAILFKKKLKYIVLNRDDEWFEYYNKFNATIQKMTYGLSPEAEAHIEHTKLYKKGSEARVVIDGKVTLELATALPGMYNISNMTAAASLAYLLGIKTNDIIEGIANLEGVPGRYERIEGEDFDIVVDHAHTPDALEKLLDATKTITKGKVTVVFGATGDRDKGKRPMMGEIAAKYADHIILTDDETYSEDGQKIRDEIRAGIVKQKGEHKTSEVPDRREAMKEALKRARKGDAVLITGMGHEQFRITDGVRRPWNEVKITREVLEEIKKT